MILTAAVLFARLALPLPPAVAAVPAAPAVSPAFFAMGRKRTSEREKPIR